MMHRPFIFTCFMSSFLFAALPSVSVRAHVVDRQMTAAARHLLAGLDAGQRDQVQFEFDSSERQDWHFIPKDRKGLSWKQMRTDQRQLAYVLLASGLSYHGFSEALTIMTLEQILHEMEDHSPSRDPEKYHVFIFGKPGPRGTWGWRIEGHHLSVNFTLRDGHVVSSTPAFFGSNPAHVKQGPQKGLRVLAREEDLGRKLVVSLDDQQRAQAIIETSAPRDVIIGPGRDAETLTPLGISFSDLTQPQQSVLKQLVRTYLFRIRNLLAKEHWKQVEEDGWDKVSFAWAGGLRKGEGHYYRVQGPSFILEYDNTQNDANHVHTVWRDMKNDFGRDALKLHYEQAHGSK